MSYLVLRWTRDTWGVYTPDGDLVKRLTSVADALDLPNLYGCDACGKLRPCCVTRMPPAGEGSFCHTCRGDHECDLCQEEL